MPGRVGELMAHHIRRHPEAPALVAPDGSLTYAALDRRATALARRLVRQGVRPGDVVLVQLPRGVTLGVTVLGVLRAGGALCVVDPSYPSERIRHMWRHSGARLALVSGPDAAPEPGPRLLVPDTVRPGQLPADDLGPTGPELAPPLPTDLAYAVFTSGSSGGPKAIAMPHRCLDNLVAWTLAGTSAEPLRTLMFAPLGFDVFVQEVFTAWCSGGCLYVPADEQRSDLQQVLELLSRWRIQRLFVPPVALSRLADLAGTLGPVPEDLREVAAAGEALRITPGIRELFARLPDARLHNHYGPAETHVALAHTLTGPPRTWPDAPPIGRPVPGMAAHLRPVAGRREDRASQGDTELWLSGVGLAHGYLRDEERTDRSFAPLPTEEGTVRAYRTGDLVHRRQDGLLEYAGRVDDQVKIRGYRVEPGEVECALGRHPAVRECAVVAWEPPAGAERQLVAHVVSEAGHPPDPAALRAHLAALLPDHMVPRHVVTATALPLSPNGKVDRRRLPAPSVVPEPSSSAPGPGGTPAGGPVADAVARLWTEVLGVQVTDPGHSFVDLGGTSLSAAVVVTRLHARYGVRIDLQEFLRTPTVGALSALITERAGA
ncbi:amino acid adenylation domain-containing protein [Streptomyces sp. TM32]|uniref:non-ribosomal peptide synthetase n=1 Tax=Streptomyces sp. TM32 TaxID=1652669 RepID=UPI001011F3A0|nr:non-ribosomal peptide synthetase [Streptomyces sp. TM32]RXS84646.1 amino acid adenylation domain-containing protein [Streptomyces sp. TM32]